jgi:arylsulfatase A-like enzyme
VKGGTSDALICQVDLLASLAKLCGAKVDHESAPDSQDVLDVLLGESDKGREALVEQSTGPQTLAIRKGNWKLISQHKINKPLPEPELYDLKNDPGETKDVAAEHPAEVDELSKLLKDQREK